MQGQASNSEETQDDRSIFKEQYNHTSNGQGLAHYPGPDQSVDPAA
jgi:hypothetical protein